VVPFPKVGDRVEVTGKTAIENQTYVVSDPRFRILEHQPLPTPLSIEETDLLTPPVSAFRVEMTGLVRQALLVNDRVQVDLQKGKTRVVCHIHDVPADFDLDSLVGARVKALGVCAHQYEEGKIARANLFIPDLASMQVLSWAPASLDSMPVVSIHSLIETTQEGVEAPRIRIQGVVVRNQGNSFVLRDPTGAIEVRSASSLTRQIDERLDVWGFPTVGNQRIVLEDAIYEARSQETVVVQERAPEPLANPDVTLRYIRDVRALSNAQAARFWPVLLEGVVLYADPEWKLFFMQDETGAVFVQGWLQNLKVGDRVAVEGGTGAGSVMPLVTGLAVRLIGQGELPEPLRVKELRAVYYDCAWVELEGVVRSVEEQPGHGLLHLFSPQGRFDAVVPDPHGAQAFRHLINARIRLRGVAGIQLNRLDQVLGVKLHWNCLGSSVFTSGAW
jgi:hypothetical protein